MSKRRSHDAAIEARAALEAVKGEGIVYEPAAGPGVRPTMIRHWKRSLPEGAAGIFERGGKAAAAHAAHGGQSPAVVSFNTIAPDQQVQAAASISRNSAIAQSAAVINGHANTRSVQRVENGRMERLRPDVCVGNDQHVSDPRSNNGCADTCEDPGAMDNACGHKEGRFPAPLLVWCFPGSQNCACPSHESIAPVAPQRRTNGLGTSFSRLM